MCVCVCVCVCMCVCMCVSAECRIGDFVLIVKAHTAPIC